MLQTSERQEQANLVTVPIPGTAESVKKHQVYLIPATGNGPSLFYSGRIRGFTGRVWTPQPALRCTCQSPFSLKP